MPRKHKRPKPRGIRREEEHDSKIDRLIARYSSRDEQRSRSKWAEVHGETPKP